MVTQGPIVRHKTVKDTLYGDNKLNLDNILQGVTLILWGGGKETCHCRQTLPLCGCGV